MQPERNRAKELLSIDGKSKKYIILHMYTQKVLISIFCVLYRNFSDHWQYGERFQITLIYLKLSIGSNALGAQ